MNMLLTLFTLITVFIIDCTWGKAFDSQRNNKDIFRKDLRGMQRAKEMLSSDRANFYTNPWKSETNDRSAFKRFSVPIPNDVPASTMSSFLSQLTAVPTSRFSHFHVPTNATSTATGLTSLMSPQRLQQQLRQRLKSPQQELQQQTRQNISSTSAKQLELNTRQEAQAFCIPPRKRLKMQLQVSCCLLIRTTQQLQWQLTHRIFCFMPKSAQQLRRQPMHRISCCFSFETIQPIPSFI
jgi:hypothetical protein